MSKRDGLRSAGPWSRSMPVIIFAVTIAAFAAISTTRAAEPLKSASSPTVGIIGLKSN